MATQDLTQGTAGQRPGNVDEGGIYTLRRKIDFAVNGGGSGEVLQVFKIAAGMRVLAVAIKTLKVEGATCVVDVGDGTDPNGYIAAHDCNALDRSVSSPVITGGSPSTVLPAFALGKDYAVDDTLDVVLGTAATDFGQIEVVASVMDLTVQAEASD